MLQIKNQKPVIPMRAKDILFYIKDCVPNDAERAAAAKLGTKKFRNAAAVHPGDFPELAEQVSGCVPANYFDKDGRPIEFKRGVAIQILPVPAADPVVATAPVAAIPPTPATAIANTPPPPFVDSTLPPPPVAPPPPAPVAQYDENSTNAELKAVLDSRGIGYPSNANKATLLTLLNN